MLSDRDRVLRVAHFAEVADKFGGAVVPVENFVNVRLAEGLGPL